MPGTISANHLNNGSFYWELFVDGSEDDRAIACICGYPAPSRGDLINHEDFDKPLKVTRIEWSIRRGYGLQADVYVEPSV